MITPLSTDEAVAQLSDDPDPDRAQAFIDLLQEGDMIAGVDENGKLHFKLTDKGNKAAADLGQAAHRVRIAVVLKWPTGKRRAFLAPQGWSEARAMRWGVANHPWPESIDVFVLHEMPDSL